MMFLRLLFLVFILSPLLLISLNDDSDVLIYGDNVQISSEINEGESITANSPIQGTVMVTHNKNNLVDVSSFSIGRKHLKVEFVKEVSMSSYSDLVVTVYQFQLEGMAPGFQTLPSIKVNVGGKEYEAPPLQIKVPE